MNRRNLRAAAFALLSTALLLTGLPEGTTAQQKAVKIGLSLPLTGADADGADAIMKGAQMAVAEINAKGGAGGYKLEAVVYDSATPAAGQYDPAQAATNYKKFIADSLVLAAVGPVMSGEGKAISPILSEADMATITPELDQPRHHRSEVPVAVPAQGQGGVLPHRHHRRLPGPEHGELPLPQPEDEERLHPGRRRRLRRGDRRQLPEAAPRSSA